MRPFSFIVVLFLLAPAVLQPSPEKEQVRLTYDLILNHCKEDNCNTDTGHGEVIVNLEPEDKTFLWGYAADEQFVGFISYQLRFEAKRIHDQRGTKRVLIIGFSGRRGAPSYEQVTFGEKSFTGKTWKALPAMHVQGNSYFKNDEQVTPTLTVSVAQ
jgi:hypothetical protein